TRYHFAVVATPATPSIYPLSLHDALPISLEAIQRAEDRELFKRAMAEIGQPVAESRIVSSMDEARSFLHDIGLPIIVRPAFTLGGTGGGIANTEEQFEDIVRRGLTNSPIKQVLLERSVAGWKEIEFEVIRDAA